MKKTITKCTSHILSICMIVTLFTFSSPIDASASSNYTQVTNTPPGAYVPKTIIANNEDFAYNIIFRPGDKIVSGTDSSNNKIYFRFVNEDLTTDVSSQVGTGTLSSVYSHTSINGTPFQAYFSEFTIGSTCYINYNNSHTSSMGRTAGDEAYTGTVTIDIRMQAKPEYSIPGQINYNYDKPKDHYGNNLTGRECYLQYESQYSEQPTSRWGYMTNLKSSGSYTYHVYNPVMEGCRFTGWSNISESSVTINSDGTSNITLPCSCENYSLYPMFTPNGYTLKLTAGTNATIDGLNSKLYEVKFADFPYSVDSFVPVSSVTGAVFEGWYKDADFSGSPVTTVNYSDATNCNINLYAKWSNQVSPSADPLSTPSASPTPSVSTTAPPSDSVVPTQTTTDKSDKFTSSQGTITGTIDFDKDIPNDCVLDIRTLDVPKDLKKDDVTSAVFEICMMRNNQQYKISDNEMLITITLPKELQGKDIYTVSYINNKGELTEKQIATVNENKLQFKTNHLSSYLVEASDKLETTDTTAKENTQTSSPKTGDISYTLLYIVIIISGFIVCSLTIYRKLSKKVY